VRPPLTPLRREAIVTAAAVEFAVHGLHGGSTARIARQAGISHAYLFRFFPTKRELFLAACGRHFDRLERGSRDPQSLLGLVQALAALADPVVGAAVRPRLQRLFAERGPALSAGIARITQAELSPEAPCSPA
jgi:AcrR family transcriptional regulator